MMNKWFFGEFLSPLDVEFNVDSLHTNLFKEYRYAATNLNVSHNEIIVLHDKLGLGVIGNISIVIDSSREKPCACLFEGPSGDEHIL